MTSNNELKTAAKQNLTLCLYIFYDCDEKGLYTRVIDSIRYEKDKIDEVKKLFQEKYPDRWRSDRQVQMISKAIITEPKLSMGNTNKSLP